MKDSANGETSFERRTVVCPFCPRVGRYDQMRIHTRSHRQIREARKDLADDLQRMEMAEHEER